MARLPAKAMAAAGNQRAHAFTKGEPARASRFQMNGLHAGRPTIRASVQTTARRKEIMTALECLSTLPRQSRSCARPLASLRVNSILRAPAGARWPALESLARRLSCWLPLLLGVGNAMAQGSATPATPLCATARKWDCFGEWLLSPPAATVLAALIAAVGVGGTLLFNSWKDRHVAHRRKMSLQVALAADARSVLRVIDAAGIIEQVIIKHAFPSATLPMAGSPRGEDYFTLYSAVAKDLGEMNRDIAERLSAFYQLLKGSRDIAASYGMLAELEIPESIKAALISDVSIRVLQSLEHVYRNGFIAMYYAAQDLRKPLDIQNGHHYVRETFNAWMLLLAVQNAIDQPSFDVTDAKAMEDALTSSLASRFSEIKKGVDSMAFETWELSGKNYQVLDLVDPAHEKFAEGPTGKALAIWSKRIVQAYASLARIQFVQRDTGSTALESAQPACQPHHRLIAQASG